MICGVVENILKAFSRWFASCDWLAWKREPNSSGHAKPDFVSLFGSEFAKWAFTLVCVLSRELSNSISNLAPHRIVRLVGKAGEQLGADGVSLRLLESEEEVLGLARRCLSRFRGLAPEDDGSKCSCLAAK